MQGTLSDGHSGFMITLFHLASHHSDERGGGGVTPLCLLHSSTRLVVMITPHTSGSCCPMKLLHLYEGLVRNIGACASSPVG